VDPIKWTKKKICPSFHEEEANPNPNATTIKAKNYPIFLEGGASPKPVTTCKPKKKPKKTPSSQQEDPLPTL
jgi:hypothetical protein